jgi:outer membrane protein OmpA-like peptidoglycan-associated protein
VNRAATTALALALLAVAGAPAIRAQVVGPPAPIPTPPIPAPPQLGPNPKLNLPSLSPPARPVIGIPDAAELDRLPIPPEAAITPADKADPVPPPQSASLTAAPPMVSPGAAASQIEEAIFIIDPGVSQLSAAAQGKLANLATEMAQNKAARLEVRTYSPSKAHGESAAHRLSLARFFAIRDFLVHNGVSDDRIDGRPLISSPNELNADRVELYIER